MGMARGRTTYEVVHPTVTVAKKKWDASSSTIYVKTIMQKLKSMILLERPLKDLHFEWSDNTLSSFVLEH